MKIKINNYSFNPTLKKITFSDYTTISLENVLLITNTTNNIIIYNFANPSLGGSVSGNVLTLSYNTTTMLNTDSLQIYYDDGKIEATELKQDILNNLVSLVESQIENDNVINRQLLQLLKPLGIVTNGTFRLNVDINAGGTINQVTLVPTVTTVGTVNTIANQTNIGGLNAFDLQFNAAHTAYATSIRNNINF